MFVFIVNKITKRKKFELNRKVNTTYCVLHNKKWLSRSPCFRCQFEISFNFILLNFAFRQILRLGFDFLTIERLFFTYVTLITFRVT